MVIGQQMEIEEKLSKEVEEFIENYFHNVPLKYHGWPPFPPAAGTYDRPDAGAGGGWQIKQAAEEIYDDNDDEAAGGDVDEIAESIKNILLKKRQSKHQKMCLESAANFAAQHAAESALDHEDEEEGELDVMPDVLSIPNDDGAYVADQPDERSDESVEEDDGYVDAAEGASEDDSDGDFIDAAEDDYEVGSDDGFFDADEEIAAPNEGQAESVNVCKIA